jgi:2-methylisocitrate lyase-like PEP mutase family enzyme
MADPRLKEMIRQGEFILAPGVFDLMTTALANRAGHRAVYASGYWNVASLLGLPDAGIATYRDFVTRFGLIAERSDAPVIADADTGFGGLLNLAHTVAGYEAAGLAAIQIEDQSFPKKCGHSGSTKVVPLEEMVSRIKVACDTRSDPDFLIIARTDARPSLGLDEALRRADAYAAAGADILFVEAPRDPEEMRRICAAGAPQIVNMAHGGQTPILPVATLIEIGYAAAIFPAAPALAAMQAAAGVYDDLLHRGMSEAPMFEFREMSRLMGFDEVLAFEKRWERG